MSFTIFDNPITDLITETIEECIDDTPIGKIKKMVENNADACQPEKIISRFINGMNVDEAREKLQKGDHLYVQRLGYTHHAIYDEDGIAIHYLRDIGVTYASLDDFADGSKINLKSSKLTHSRTKVIKRARSRLFESEYNLATYKLS